VTLVGSDTTNFINRLIRIEHSSGPAIAHRLVKKGVHSMRILRPTVLAFFTVVSTSPPLIPICKTAPAQSTDEFPTSRLKQAVKEAKTDLEKKRSDLKTQYEKEPGSQQSILSGYLFQDVISGIDKGKTVLIDSLGGSELAGYRAHVRQFYPKPKLEFVGYSLQKPLVTVESANESFARAEKYIGKIEASAASPVIDLMINSTPTTSYFEMWVDGELSGRNLTTNNPMKNIARGYYSYRVTKADHKIIEFKLDLINGDGTELNCTMNKSDDREGPYPCSLR
jgi:hypothetical protein